MIYLAKQEYELHYQEQVIVVKGTHERFCPFCKGKLHVHGTCHRKMRMIEQNYIFRLRVMKCSVCGKTHRELPHFFAPYKHYGMEAICEILCSETGKEPCSASARSRLTAWLWSIIACAQSMMIRERFEDRCFPCSIGAARLARILMRIIYELVNKKCKYSSVFQTKKPPA